MTNFIFIETIASARAAHGSIRERDQEIMASILQHQKNVQKEHSPPTPGEIGGKIKFHFYKSPDL